MKKPTICFIVKPYLCPSDCWLNIESNQLWQTLILLKYITKPWLLNYTVARILLQTYELYTFLKSLWCVCFKLFLGGAPFFKRNVNFRCLNQNKRFFDNILWSMPYFMVTHVISCMFLGYLKPYQASKCLILKLISIPWQEALQPVGLSTWKCRQEQCKVRRIESLAGKK